MNRLRSVDSSLNKKIWTDGNRLIDRLIKKQGKKAKNERKWKRQYYSVFLTVNILIR